MIDDYLNRFICGDNAEVLSKFPSDSVDLIFTSPPYSDMRNYGVDGSSASPDDYPEWLISKCYQFKRVLKPTGSFILNINDKVVNGKQNLYVYEIVLSLCKDLGFNLVRDYIWYNPSSPPNCFSSGKYGRTKKSHEYCFWFSKSNHWKFNMDPIRKPYSKDMQKFLNGKGKGKPEGDVRPSTYTFNCTKVWTDHGGSDPGSVIEIGNTSSNDSFMKMCKSMGIAHPARFPEKLAEFFILAGSDPGDVVLDPFSGSGTCAVSAQRNNRKWIGIDINQDYCDLSTIRMRNEFGDVVND